MTTERILIGHIPALLWGAPSRRLIIAVHGSMASKDDPTIARLADVAAQTGHRVLSFDLPEHGERRGSPERCDVVTGVRELESVLARARLSADRLSLFAVSIGAYFSLMAYAKARFERALFLSPVVDMRRVIENMMGAFGVTEARLEAEREIATPIGQTLSWPYYRYAKDHPVDSWPSPTAVLCGEHDDLSERERVEAFCERFGGALTVMPGGEHWFHTEAQMAFYERWLEQQLGG